MGGVFFTLSIMLVTALGMLAMTMSIVGRANHPRIVGAINGFLNIILFFPSGALYPIRSFPPWLRAFARVNPETHAVAALKSVLFRGGDLGATSGHVLFLVGFTAVDAAALHGDAEEDALTDARRSWRRSQRRHAACSG